MTETHDTARRARSGLRQRAAWIGLGVLSFAATLLLLHSLGPSKDEASEVAVAAAAPSALPTLAFTQRQRHSELSLAFLDDAIAALEQSLKEGGARTGWAAVAELRAFGPKTRAAAVQSVLELWRSSQAQPSAGTTGSDTRVPEAFAAAPSAALLGALLYTGQPLEPPKLGALLAGGSAAPESNSGLALMLEAQTLLASRQSHKSAFADVARLSSLAQTRLARSLRQLDALSWQDWQLACAVLHAPPEVEADRQAELRRLWARLQATSLPSDLLSQALRAEALASAIKSGHVAGKDTAGALTSELEHLRYLVNTEPSADALDARVVASYALRALRLGKSALADFGGRSERGL